jgi:tRNA threonylcarbamoyladenosine modification (KEOPS) complex Cgi121 subunit/molybdopterin converting factor small subunit
MIRIRLLGGAKKAVGRPSLDLDREQASVSEVLTFLQGVSQEPRLLQAGNLIIAVNGIDSQALSGPDTVARKGDTVTIVTVVHGGMDNNYSVLVAGVRSIDSKDAGKLLDRLRAENPGVLVQAADAAVVYGREHALGVLGIALEAMARRIMIANRPETEMLLRLACTDQIAEAMKRARLREDLPGCFIAFSPDAQALKKFGEQISQEFELDDSVILPSGEKKKALAKTTGISPKAGDGEFLDLLLERAAILVKS